MLVTFGDFNMDVLDFVYNKDRLGLEIDAYDSHINGYTTRDKTVKGKSFGETLEPMVWCKMLSQTI